MATHAAGETGHTQQGYGLVVADSGDGGGGSGTAMEMTLSQSTGARARQWRQCWHRGTARDGRSGVGLTQGTSDNGGQARARVRQVVTGGSAGFNQGSTTGGSGGATTRALNC